MVAVKKWITSVVDNAEITALSFLLESGHWSSLNTEITIDPCRLLFMTGHGILPRNTEKHFTSGKPASS